MLKPPPSAAPADHVVIAGGVPFLYQHALEELMQLGYTVENGDLMPPADGIPVPQKALMRSASATDESLSLSKHHGLDCGIDHGITGVGPQIGTHDNPSSFAADNVDNTLPGLCVVAGGPLAGMREVGGATASDDLDHAASKLETHDDTASVTVALGSPPAAPVKDHEIRNAVTELCAVAVECHAMQQLRARISGIVVPLVRSAQASAAVQAAQGLDAHPSLDDLRAALQFYADGDHFVRHEPSAWDTVSDERPNFYEDESSTATVEDGTIAKMTLAGRLTATDLADDDDGIGTAASEGDGHG